jgi:hypothetical protein
MRFIIMLCWMLLCSVASAAAEFSFGVAVPGLSIGFNLPSYPQLVPVPGYPVYYAPNLDSNYFFYDGMYWLYQDDNWYASSWYNGPWGLVDPMAVPAYILQIPVGYYRHPPMFFRGWRAEGPPHWGQHWGHEWEHSRGGWSRQGGRAAPAPAPLPLYQRQYQGNRYPQAQQQFQLHSQNYRYQPREPIVRQQYQQMGARRQSGPAQRGAPGEHPERGWRQ